jgi:hypothetical protein
MTTFGQFGIDAAVEWGDKAYFFRGTQYIRVSMTGPTGPGHVDPGYPRPIAPSWGWPAGFGANGISAAMSHPREENQVIFFSRGQYVIVYNNFATGPGQLVTPQPLDDGEWWPFGTGLSRVTGAVKWTRNTSYFFSGDQFAIYHHQGQGNEASDWEFTGRGPISVSWGYWPAGFGDNGIDDAIVWREYIYVFSGGKYIRIHIESEGQSDKPDPGYPRNNAPNWAWPTL